MERINVGLIGFGTVGSGVVKVLGENASVIKDRLGCELVLKKIADTDIKRDRGVDLKGAELTEDAEEVLNDPDISIVIELVGGKGVAKDFALKALDNGKHLVTANKALLSAEGKQIFDKSLSLGLDVGFEASVGGGIPIIKALREGLAANDITSIYGIINGTANFILTKMTDEGGSFADVLKEAQDMGCAEADPTFDIEGNDSAHKLAILINLAFGTYMTDADIYTEGISRITELDLNFAAEFGFRVKLLAVAKAEDDGAIEARVHPTLFPLSHPLASVEGVFNAVLVEGDAVGPTMYYGKGAGMMPTASAVVADVIDIARNIMNGSCGRVNPLGFISGAIRNVRIKDIEEVKTSYYIRISAADKPSVLAKVSAILGDNDIGVSSVMQKGIEAEGAVPLVMLTHTALEKNMRKAVREIEALDVIKDKVIYIRVEEDVARESQGAGA